MLNKLIAEGIIGASLIFPNFNNSSCQINKNQDSSIIAFRTDESPDKYADKRKEFVENAKKYLGTKYQWDGRNTKKNPNLDCLGLIFLAYSKTYNKKWTEISVNPSEIVKKEQLGKPVKGLEGVLKDSINFSKLEEGDIIYLLSTSEIKDKPLAKINGIDYWPWHTGIYSDKKNNLLLHAEPGKKVVETDFKEYLNKTITDGIFITEAIFVTRIYSD